MTTPERRVHTFDTREVRRLGGLPFEKQVIEILFELDEPVPASKLRSLLVPPPSDAAIVTMLDKLRKRNEIAEYPHPSGDSIHAPLIGLPGWALRDKAEEPSPASPILMNTEPTRLAPAAAAQTTKENSMSKAQRAPRVSAEKADQAVESLLRNSTETLSVASIARDAELNPTATKAALKRLAKAGRVAAEGRGKGVKYGAVIALAPSVNVSPTAAVPPISHPKKPNGKARFGFYNDGDVHIEASRCTGVLSREEWQALLEYSEHRREAA